MKKVISLLLVLAMLAAGCGTKTDGMPEQEDIGNKDIEVQSMPQEEEPAAEVTEDSSSDSSVLSVLDEIYGEQKIKLKFHDDGTFRVLVFSDLHTSGDHVSKQVIDNMNLIIDRENPDFVAFDGDNTWAGASAKQVENLVREFTAHIEELGIPWGHVYGNHDAESGNTPKKKQQEIYESFDHCLSKAGPEDIDGMGNYILPIYAHDSDEIKYNLWALDSGEYISSEFSEQFMPSASLYKGHQFSSYASIPMNQVVWYYNTSVKLEKKLGYKVPTLMYFHIPLQECYNAWMNRAGITYTGGMNEDICAGELNSGLFAAVTERGDVKAMVFGHDHTNDFMFNYCGVKLCGASTVSPLCYWNEEVAGARVFVLHEDGTTDTYMSYLYSKVELNAEDYEKLNDKVLLDFENYKPEFSVSSFDNNINASAHPDEINVSFSENRGIGGSKAIAVTRDKYYGENTADNFEVKMTIENPGTLGDNKYMRVWMDLTGDSVAVDFRKADFGLIVNYAEGSAYCTDNLDAVSDFWYLAEDSDTWVKMHFGSDGCFGAAQNSSVKGFKGWFAFPLENMLKFSTNAKLKSDSIITGVYFYGCLNEKKMAGEHIYIDDICLTKDYTVFN